MTVWDWVIAAVPILFCTLLAVYSRRYTRSVAHFMAGGRHAGRYMIATATSETTSGALSLVAQMQVIMVAGFTVYWWQQISVPVALLVAVSGFVIYRYRQTRAMTLAQFFEMRYSRNFRLFAGTLGFFGGILNFGIGPIVVSRFFVYFLQMPPTLALGGWAVKTEWLVMAAMLLVSVIMACAGGQITVLLTNSVEGILTLFLYAVIVITVMLTYFHWAHLREILVNTEPGHSYVNPFDAFNTKNFNVWFILMGLFMTYTSLLAFQMGHAFNSSAITPHESRMGATLGSLRSFTALFMFLFLGVCALTYVHTAAGQAAVDEVLAHIPDKTAAKQMSGPIALSLLLPMGAKGALVAAAIMGTISTTVIHIHSWGSIFIQDVVLPLRQKPFAVEQHLRLLRWTIVGVAVWGFFFGVFVPLTDYLPLWFAITMGVFTSGAGCVIMGGLYWSRGTTAGAWTSLILGATVNLGGIAFRMIYAYQTQREFFLNPQHFAFIATVLSILSYIGVSLLTCRQPHNMDKLLHRGAYAVTDDKVQGSPAAPGQARPWWMKLFGVSENIPPKDRWITIFVSSYGLFWFSVLTVVTCLYWLVGHWSKEAWADYWLVAGFVIPMILGAVTLVWYTIGGIHDLRVFFRRLHGEHIDNTDDGTVKASEH